MSYLSLLTVFAHPDDEACGPAGTLAKYAHAGVQVSLICATRGEAASSCCLPEPVTPEEMARIRTAELRCSAHVLGIKQTVVLGFPDGKLGVQDQEQLQQELVWLMSRIRPQVVITFGPHGHTGHPDHVAVGWATLVAFRRAQQDGNSGPSRLFYVCMPGTRSAERAHVVIDASEYVNYQLRAMRCYQSQRGCWESLLKQVGQKGLRHQCFYLAWSSQPWDYRQRDGTDLFAGIE
ncbi:MAG: PIG-L deacetylase family protein [Anaerolineae bacterium]